MITLREQLDAVKREVELRRTTYPRWVREGRMSPERAAHGIAVMEAVAETVAYALRCWEVTLEMQAEENKR